MVTVQTKSTKVHQCLYIQIGNKTHVPYIETMCTTVYGAHLKRTQKKNTNKKQKEQNDGKTANGAINCSPYIQIVNCR